MVNIRQIGEALGILEKKVAQATTAVVQKPLVVGQRVLIEIMVPMTRIQSDYLETDFHHAPIQVEGKVKSFDPSKGIYQVEYDNKWIDYNLPGTSECERTQEQLIPYIKREN